MGVAFSDLERFVVVKIKSPDLDHNSVISANEEHAFAGAFVDLPS